MILNHPNQDWQDLTAQNVKMSRYTMCFGGIFDIFLYHLSQDQQVRVSDAGMMKGKTETFVRWARRSASRKTNPCRWRLQSELSTSFQFVQTYPTAIHKSNDYLRY